MLRSWLPVTRTWLGCWVVPSTSHSASWSTSWSACFILAWLWCPCLPRPTPSAESPAGPRVARPATPCSAGCRCTHTTRHKALMATVLVAC
ncbi:hypothetical protein V8C86DRAFT_2482651, partial [Haematococcus lacustris]